MNHQPSLFLPSVFPKTKCSLCRGRGVGGVGGTYGHCGQCQPHRSEHWGGDGASLVGVSQAGVTAVEPPLVWTNSGAVQNQAGQHSYTHTHTHTWGWLTDTRHTADLNCVVELPPLTCQLRGEKNVTLKHTLTDKPVCVVCVCELIPSLIRLFTQQTLSRCSCWQCDTRLFRIEVYSLALGDPLLLTEQIHADTQS